MNISEMREDIRKRGKTSFFYFERPFIGAHLVFHFIGTLTIIIECIFSLPFIG